MRLRIDRRTLLSQAGLGGVALAGMRGALATPASGDIASLIAAEREAIGAGMAEGAISAAAVSLVQGGKAAWVEGFGRRANGRPVTPDTRFSIQSTSKSFTAVAVLLAVQQRLLDLDVPITRYLPGFAVHSRFEKAAAERMTLRLLLSHRAGFTHEAPVGNNYEPASPSFKAHVDSISDTWLRFPVGDRYRYSNLGYDLAGRILERRTGLGYAEWLRRELLDPLGMLDSTADPAVYTRTANRAVGNHRGYEEVPLVTPLVASGGVWSSTRDMAAYAIFLASGGRWQGRQLLAQTLWDEMHDFTLGDYGLGAIREQRRYGATPIRILTHRGGGFGFGCEFFYCPEAELGWAAMFNRPALAGYRLGAGLVEKLLTARFGARAPHDPAATHKPLRPSETQARTLCGSYVGRNLQCSIRIADGQLHLDEGKGEPPRALHMATPDRFFIVGPDGEAIAYRHHPATASLPAHLECARGEASLDRNEAPDDPPGPNRAEWRRHAGRYRVDQWGRAAINVTVELRSGYLYLNGIRLIVETEPGLFFTSDGEAVDFRNAIPTWRSLQLHRM